MTKLVAYSLSLICFVTGLGLVWWKVGWMPALALFLLDYSRNLRKVGDG